MIRLKQLLREIANPDIQQCLDKIQRKEFRLIGAGDNGRVYEIDGEDKVFKITKEQDEYAVAERVVDRYKDFTCFIPVYYVDGKNMYIMANAEPLQDTMKQTIDNFMRKYAAYARENGGEVSVFEFVAETNETDPVLDNFLNTLQFEVEKLNIPDIELDLDFRSENIMLWNGNMVLVDW